MTVQKFRSVEQMNAASVHVDAADGFERFIRHCARYWAVAPRTYPRGVQKFRSIEEAQAAREAVAIARGGERRPERSHDVHRADGRSSDHAE